MKHSLLNIFIGMMLLPFYSLSISSASEFDFIPQNQPQQKELHNLLKQNHFEQALKVWPVAMESTNFSQTATGQALYHYLLYRSGLTVNALEQFFNISHPQNIHPQMRHHWQKLAQTDHKAWKLADIRWQAKWKNIFGQQMEERIRPFAILSVSNKSQLTRALAQLPKTSAKNSEAEIWQRWQVALAAPVVDEPDIGLNQLNILADMKQSLISQDQIDLAYGRIYFQKGDLSKALHHYNKIPKSSDFWLEAREERAWTYVRLNQENKALADIMTLRTPIFRPLLGPEPHFLHNFINLKICDYPQIFKTSEHFKDISRDRLNHLQTLAQKGQSEPALTALMRLDQGAYELKTIGPLADQLPRNFHRDEFFMRHMKYRRALLAEATKAQNILSASLMSSDSNPLVSIIARSQERSERSRIAALKRLQTLAKEDLYEYSQNIQKFHLVEAEVIQRLYLQEEIHGRRQTLGENVRRNPNILTFPVNSREVWLDELDKYHVKVKDCPKIERVAL